MAASETVGPCCTKYTGAPEGPAQRRESRAVWHGAGAKSRSGFGLSSNLVASGHRIWEAQTTSPSESAKADPREPATILQRDTLGVCRRRILGRADFAASASHSSSELRSFRPLPDVSLLHFRAAESDPCQADELPTLTRPLPSNLLAYVEILSDATGTFCAL